MVDSNNKSRRGFITEGDIASLLQRYEATTVLRLLQEVACYAGPRIDWNALVKRTSTGITNAREYQMLWRHLAYRDSLLPVEDDAQILDDDSDLEYELESFPHVNSEASVEAAAHVKVMVSSYAPSESNNPNNSTVEAPLIINIPNGLSYKGSQEPSESPWSSRGINITFPVSLQKSTSTEALSGIGSASGSMASRKKRKKWSTDEDEELIAAVKRCGEGNWAHILKGEFKGDRTASQLSQRWALIRKRCETSSSVATQSGLQRTEVQMAANHALSLAVGNRIPSKKLATGISPITSSGNVVGALAAGCSSSQVQQQSQPKPVPALPWAAASASVAKPRVTVKKTTANSTSRSDLVVTANSVAAAACMSGPSPAASMPGKNVAASVPGKNVAASVPNAEPGKSSAASVPKAEPGKNMAASVQKAEPRTNTTASVPKAEHGISVGATTSAVASVPKTEPGKNVAASVPKAEPGKSAAASVQKAEPGRNSAASVPKAEPRTNATASVPKAELGKHAIASVPKAEPGKSAAASVPKAEPGKSVAASVPKAEPGKSVAASVPKAEPGKCAVALVSKSEPGRNAAISVPKAETGKHAATSVPKAETGKNASAASLAGSSCGQSVPKSEQGKFVATVNSQSAGPSNTPNVANGATNQTTAPSVPINPPAVTPQPEGPLSKKPIQRTLAAAASVSTSVSSQPCFPASVPPAESPSKPKVEQAAENTVSKEDDGAKARTQGAVVASQQNRKAATNPETMETGVQPSNNVIVQSVVASVPKKASKESHSEKEIETAISSGNGGGRESKVLSNEDDGSTKERNGCSESSEAAAKAEVRNGI